MTTQLESNTVDLSAGYNLLLIGRRHSTNSDGKLLRIGVNLAHKLGIRTLVRKAFLRLERNDFHVTIEPRMHSVFKKRTITQTLFDIKEVNVGRSTRNLQRYGGSYEDDSCFYLELTGHNNAWLVTLDFACPAGPQECLKIVESIKGARVRAECYETTLITQSPSLRNPREGFWKKQFRSYDSNRDEALSRDELTIMLNSLGLDNVKTKEVLNSYQGSKMTFEGFANVARTLKLNDVLGALFQAAVYGEDENYLNSDNLRRFLGDEGQGRQQEDKINKIIQEFDKHPEEGLDKHEFGEFLLSTSHNSVLEMTLSPLYEDFPLSSYLISSSHNTYILGDQVSGSCSVDGYRYAIERGFRCVEVDVMNGIRGKPVISHKNSLTEVLSFESFTRAAKTFAFKRTKLPLIVSIENHCSKAQQQVMAKLLLKYWGSDFIYAPPEAPGSKASLPSLREVAYKFIIKCKVTEKTHPDLARLVFFRTGTGRATHTSTGFADRPVSCILSFDENAANVVELSEGFTETHLVRVYPSGLRMSSSNLNPIPSWSRGFQLVSLNAQTHCQRFRMNQVLFQDNGGFANLEQLRGAGHEDHAIELRVLMGHMLPCAKSKNRTSALVVEAFEYDILKCTQSASAWSLDTDFESGIFRSGVFGRLKKSLTSPSERSSSLGQKKILRQTETCSESQVSAANTLNSGHWALRRYDTPILRTEPVFGNAFNPQFAPNSCRISSFTPSTLLLFVVVECGKDKRVRAFGGGLLARMKTGVHSLPLYDSTGLPLPDSCLLLSLKSNPSPLSTTNPNPIGRSEIVLV